MLFSRYGEELSEYVAFSTSMSIQDAETKVLKHFSGQDYSHLGTDRTNGFVGLEFQDNSPQGQLVDMAIENKNGITEIGVAVF